MAHCTQCGHALRDADRFCGKCGAPTDQSPRRPAAGRTNAHTPALQTPEGRQAYDAIVARKRSVSRGVTGVGLTSALLLATAGYWVAPNGTLYGAAALVGVVTLVVAASVRRWSEKLYYTIPGSKDQNGEHRCIHCGHRGIYRHTQYKTTTTEADCSKCKAPLWVE